MSGPAAGDQFVAVEYVVHEYHGAASQSNRRCQTAAAVAKLGLKRVLALARDAESALVQGNLLLDHILGAEVRLAETSGSALSEIKKEVGEEYRAQGYISFICTPPDLSHTVCHGLRRLPNGDLR